MAFAIVFSVLLALVMAGIVITPIWYLSTKKRKK